MEHHDLVLAFLRFQVGQFDEFHKKVKKYDLGIETANKNPTNRTEGSRHTVNIPSAGANQGIILGAKEAALDIKTLLEDRKGDPGFTSFCSRVSNAVQALSPELADTIAINDSHQVRSLISFILYVISQDPRLTDCTQITEYRYIRVKYESMVDWHIKMDYLRCNPKFNKRPRYDFVIVNRPQGRIFAQLVSVFICRADGHEYHLALVQSLDKQSWRNTSHVDKSLSIQRWHIRARNRCEVIPLNSIVRGAVLVADPRYAGDYFVIDTLDEDMFLRLKTVSRDVT